MLASKGKGGWGSLTQDMGPGADWGGAHLVENPQSGLQESFTMQLEGEITRDTRL